MEELKRKQANGHPYVDLELPSGALWATMNVGASKPTESGLYFQWGDIVGYKEEQIGKEPINKRFEYFLLCFMSFLVLIFLRLSLSSFYQIMLSSNIFFILLIAYYLLFLFAIYSFINSIKCTLTV